LDPRLNEYLIYEGCSDSGFTEHRSPLLLDRPGEGWLVTEGKVEIFSARLQEQVPVGRRFHFCTIEAGRMLLGMDVQRLGEGWGLLAIPMPGARLHHFELRRLLGWAAITGNLEWAIGLIDGWVGALSLGISKDISPRTDCLAKPGSTVDLALTQSLRSAKGTVWIQLETGAAAYLAMEEVDSGKPALPITRDTWILAIRPSNIRVMDTGQVLEAGDIRVSLDFFYSMLFRCEDMNRRLAEVDEVNLLREKEQHETAALKQAQQSLSSILEGRALAVVNQAGDDLLFAACLLVADSAGIQLRKPAEQGKHRSHWDPLQEILHASHVKARMVHLPDRWWTLETGPLLAFRTGNQQPVAILPGPRGKLEVFDPATRTRTRLEEITASEIHPFTYMFYRPLPDRPLSGRDLLVFGLWPARREAFRVLSLGLLVGLISVSIPLFARHIVDSVIPVNDWTLLKTSGIALILALLAAGLFEVCRNIALLRIEGQVDFTLQSALMDRLLRLPASFFSRFSAGDLTERTLNVYLIRQMLSGSVLISLLGILFAGFHFTVLYLFDARLAVTVTALLALALVVNGIGVVWQLRYARPAVEREGRLASLVFQLLSGISKIKVAKAETHAFAVWAREFAGHRFLVVNSRKVAAFLAAFNQVFPWLALILMFIIASGLRSEGVTTGEFLAAIVAMLTFSAAMIVTCSTLTGLVRIGPLYNRVKPILQERTEEQQAFPHPGELKGGISISHLSFRYGPNEPLVLDDVCISIAPGECVAIVGPSGSGKSTLLRLMLGFETPETGTVAYDDKLLSAIDVTAVRRQVGVVLQNGQLIQGDLFFNIVGTRRLGLDDAWAAARFAGVERDIREMPMGMHTQVAAGGGTFSGGQRQRIQIARAIAGQPRILFLDEATSALDNRLQSEIIACLNEYQGSKVLIAHRLSTIRSADRIYVLAKGRVVQEGRFEELMREQGLFRELALRQLVEA
jgi:NHLM bacteriocin system ABC transporter ATP-binding protein